MHVAFLLTQDLGSPGGLGRYWPLARELVQLGHRATILALHSNFRDLSQRRFNRDGVSVYYVGQMHVQKVGNRKLFFSPARLLWVAALATWKLATTVLRVPADVYYVGKPHPMNGMSGIIASRLNRKPLFVDCDDYEAASNRFSNTWQRRVVAFFEDHLPGWATGVTVNTEFTSRRLRRLGVREERIVYLPNGVERARFEDNDIVKYRAADLRRELGLRNRPTVLYAGSLSLASHPIDLLLHAFAQVQAKLSGASLILAGGGEDLGQLERQAHDLGIERHVHFLGRVSPDAIPIYYRAVDVSVDPVRDDPVGRARCPIKLFESWAMGTPFVTANVGDRAKLRGDPPAGVLATPGDPDSLGQSLIKVLCDPHLAQILHQRGKERIQSFYWDQLVSNFMRLFDLSS